MVLVIEVNVNETIIHIKHKGFQQKHLVDGKGIKR